MRFALIACLLPSLAFGQDMTSPSGPLRIADTQIDGAPAQQLYVGDDLVEFDTYAQFLWIEKQFGSLFLIGMAMGGNACPAAYAWVHTEKGAVHASPSFGTCSDLAEVSHDAETVTVTLPDMSGSGERIAFVYDGKTLTETAVGRANSGISPGSGAEVWIGRYPFEILQAAEWQSTLADLLGPQAYADAPGFFELSSPMVEDGDWVVGQGCQKIICDQARGAIAVNKRDQRVVVVLWEEAINVRVFGDTTGAPFALLDLING